MDDLRFLATPKAIRRLAEGLREDSPLLMAAVFGFLGLPDRLHDDALRIMRSTADEPDFPVAAMFLDTMAWMHLPEEDASFSLQQLADQAAFWQYERQRIGFRNLEWQNLMASLQRKEGPALHTTEMTLLNMAPPHPNPVSLDTLAAMIRTDLAKLPPDGQARVLNECWDLIRSPALIPELRRLAQAPPEMPETPNFFFTPKDRTATALQHWYEFEPDEAATEAIRQIGRPYPDLFAKTSVFWLPAPSRSLSRSGPKHLRKETYSRPTNPPRHFSCTSAQAP